MNPYQFANIRGNMYTTLLKNHAQSNLSEKRRNIFRWIYEKSNNFTPANGNISGDIFGV
jgi:hypothetical protein